MSDKSILKTLYGLLNGKKPSLRHFHVWSCKAKVKPYIPSIKKLDSKQFLVFPLDIVVDQKTTYSTILTILPKLLNLIGKIILRIS